MACHSAEPPLAPNVELTLASLTELQLEWEEPFTWPDHNITEYRIVETLESGLTRNTTTNDTTYSYLSPDGEIQQSCQIITFMVAAYTDIGLGETFINGDHGLPIGKYSCYSDYYSSLELL